MVQQKHKTKATVMMSLVPAEIVNILQGSVGSVQISLGIWNRISEYLKQEKLTDIAKLWSSITTIMEEILVKTKELQKRNVKELTAIGLLQEVSWYKEHVFAHSTAWEHQLKWIEYGVKNQLMDLDAVCVQLYTIQYQCFFVRNILSEVLNRIPKDPNQPVPFLSPIVFLDEIGKISFEKANKSVPSECRFHNKDMATQ